jgi:hypothetical protein
MCALGEAKSFLFNFFGGPLRRKTFGGVQRFLIKMIVSGPDDRSAGDVLHLF